MNEDSVLDNKYDLYDKVVSTILTNVLIERERCGKFLLYNFKPKSDMNKLYFNVTAIAADLKKENIYLHMSLWNYIWFRIKYWRRKNLKWFSPKLEEELDDEYKISVVTLMVFIADQLDISIDLFKEINNAYYERRN